MTSVEEGHKSQKYVGTKRTRKNQPALMFISIPPDANGSSTKLILKLIRHVSVFLHQPQGAYNFVS